MMTFDAVNLIGALTYRTAKGLSVIPMNKNVSEYQKNIFDYKYWKILFNDIEKEPKTSPMNMHLWHYAGVQQEIRESWEIVSKDQLGSIKKFPAILNFQNIRQERGREPGISRVYYDLAIVAPVDSRWTTQQRNDIVMRNVLRPIYVEFMKQIERCGWVQLDFNGVHHTYTEIFTTGSSLHKVVRLQYGDYIDAIELTDFRLDVKLNQCERDMDTIITESRQVTDALIDILNNNKNN